MFEKEAEEYLDTESKYLIEDNEGNIINIAKKVKQSFIDGTEFGYNKANEWHYNGVPENENDILCQIDKDIFVVGYFHQKNKQYYTTSGEWLERVIAWKEIVLPELKESE